MTRDDKIAEFFAPCREKLQALADGSPRCYQRGIHRLTGEPIRKADDDVPDAIMPCGEATQLHDEAVTMYQQNLTDTLRPIIEAWSGLILRAAMRGAGEQNHEDLELLLLRRLAKLIMHENHSTALLDAMAEGFDQINITGQAEIIAEVWNGNIDEDNTP